MTKWYSSEDTKRNHPMDEIALSVFLTKQRYNERQENARKLQLQYEQFGEYRNTHVDEIIAKAQKVDPAKIHQPLEEILKGKGIQVGTAVDFIGGTGKHAKWLYDQFDCNVLYSDVENLTETVLPKTFSELETQKNADGSILLVDKEDPNHCVYGISALPNELNKVRSALNKMHAQGYSRDSRTNLFLGNDMLFAVPKNDEKNFAQAIDEMVAPGGIVDLSGRTMIKYGRRIDDVKEIASMFAEYKVLYAEKEKSLSTKPNAQGKEHVRVILQKPIAA